MEAYGWFQWFMHYLSLFDFFTLFATALVLVVYTVETYRLRVSAQKQVEQAIQQTSLAQKQHQTAQEQLLASIDAANQQYEMSRGLLKASFRPTLILEFKQ